MQRCAGLLSAFVLILSSAILFRQPTAVAQEASPVATEATREPLFTTTVAPEDLPDGTDLRFVIWYASIQPDVEVVLEAELFAEGPGPLIEHVLAGDLSLRVEGPLQVVRAGSVGTPGPVEEVTPGAEVVLRPAIPRSVPKTWPGCMPTAERSPFASSAACYSRSRVG
jgi:hypothetical protein